MSDLAEVLWIPSGKCFQILPSFLLSYFRGLSFSCCKLSFVFLSTTATDVGFQCFSPQTHQAEDSLISGNSPFKLALTQWFKFLTEYKTGHTLRL